MNKLLISTALLSVYIPKLLAGSFVIEAEYTYWLAGEDGLEIGRNGNFIPALDDPLISPHPEKTTVLSPSFEYQSGFQVGAGYTQNAWTLLGEYTWVRNSLSWSSAPPSLNPALGASVWLVAPWFLQLAQDGGTLSATQVNSKWTLGMDIADLSLSLACGLGDRFVTTPFAGLRAAWVRQQMNLMITTPEEVGVIAAQEITSQTGSHNWGIGPRFGVEGAALLGRGFQLEAMTGFSLLFTQFTQIFHHEDASVFALTPQQIDVEVNNQNSLTPVIECSLGAGWQKDFCRCGIDLSLDYTFSYWWNQNKMRSVLGQTWNQAPTNGDLYLHGLSLTGAFHF